MTAGAFDLTGRRMLVTGAAQRHVCGTVLDVNGGVYMAP
jgi:hypothetical protein